MQCSLYSKRGKRARSMPAAHAAAGPRFPTPWPCERCEPRTEPTSSPTTTLTLPLFDATEAVSTIAAATTTTQYIHNMFYVLTAWFTAILVIMVYLLVYWGRANEHCNIILCVCLGTTRTLLTACKLHRGVRAPPREARAVALPRCCPTQLGCPCCCENVCSRRRHGRRRWRSHPAWGESCTRAGCWRPGAADVDARRTAR